MSRKYTEEEVQKKFINHLLEQCKYWENEAKTPDLHGKMRGLLFSILSSIDGNSMDSPAFILAPNPHELDKLSDINEGQNYYPDNNHINVNCDISGNLHSVLSNYEKMFDEINNRNEKINKVIGDEK